MIYYDLFTDFVLYFFIECFVYRIIDIWYPLMRPQARMVPVIMATVMNATGSAHRWLSTRRTHLEETAKVISSSFLTPDWEEPSRREQDGRIRRGAEHVGLRTRSSSGAAAIWLASSEEGSGHDKPGLPSTRTLLSPSSSRLPSSGAGLPWGEEIQQDFGWFLHLLVSSAAFPRCIVLGLGARFLF